MMRRTNSVLACLHLNKCRTAFSRNQDLHLEGAELPNYIRGSPMNPYIGLEHDTTSSAPGEGFRAKEIHHLYRYRWNTHAWLSSGAHLNLPGKQVHWLNVSTIDRFTTRLMSEEALPHTWISMVVIMLTILQCGNYLINHPELTWNKIVWFTMKSWMRETRWSPDHDINRPVFRWFQRAPEFYGYDQYRQYMDLGVIPNDPFIEKMKAEGRLEEAQLYQHERVNGKGNTFDYLKAWNWWNRNNYVARENHGHYPHTKTLYEHGPAADALTPIEYAAGKRPE